jgi:hypothetical protein
MGYGSRTLELLSQYYQGDIVSLEENGYKNHTKGESIIKKEDDAGHPEQNGVSAGTPGTF